MTPRRSRHVGSACSRCPPHPPSPVADLSLVGVTGYRRVGHSRASGSPSRCGRRRGADLGHAAHPDVHADRGRGHPGLLHSAVDIPLRDPHPDVRDDRPLRDRVDSRHVHRQQRGRDRSGARPPRREVAVHDRGGDLRASPRSRRANPRRRRTMVPLGLTLGIGAGYTIADVDRRRRRPLPTRQRNADRAAEPIRPDDDRSARPVIDLTRSSFRCSSAGS